MKKHYQDYEELLLQDIGTPNAYYSALKSDLIFNFLIPSKPFNYETDKGEQVNGHINPTAIYCSNNKYEGVVIDCEYGSFFLVQGLKGNRIEINDYSEFLSFVNNIYNEEDEFEFDHTLQFYYPDLHLKLAPPTNILVGIKGINQFGKKEVEFTQSKIHSNVKLDKNGMAVQTGAIAEVLSRGLVREEFKVDDNFIILLLTTDFELVNALYVDKSAFIETA